MKKLTVIAGALITFFSLNAFDLQTYEVMETIKIEITYLFDAIEEGKVETVEAMIQQGVDINSQNEKGSTPLMEAVKHKDAIIVDLLIRHGANVNQPNLEGMTPLMLAAENGQLKIVENLVKNGADIKTKTPDGWTALQFAAANCRSEIIQLINGKKTLKKRAYTLSELSELQ